MSITATITSSSIIVADRNDAGLLCEVILEEARPASFEMADLALASVSLGRVGAWELSAEGNVEAVVTEIENRFNGTVAARLWDAVGTTHGDVEPVLASTVENGDIITDHDQSALYVVAGSSPRDGGTRVLMVGEGRTWNDRHEAVFHGLVWVARRKA